MTSGPCGLAVLDKPAGMTSHDVVSAVRRSLACRRVGHAGTLDPPATGVLLVGVGPATRLLRFAQATDKTYDGTFVLGATTTTLDATGEVTATFDVGHVADGDVAGAAAALTGDLDQVPPMVSAVKVAGRRLHELAREGVEVERAPRRVHVARFDVSPVGDGAWRFEVACASGTYVRALVDDLGRALGAGAHVTSLRRTGSGRFTLDDAVALDAFVAAGRDAALLAPLAMVSHLGVVTLSTREAGSFRHGRSLAAPPGALQGDERAVCDESGALLGVATIDAAGALRPAVVLASGGADADG